MALTFSLQIVPSDKALGTVKRVNILIAVYHICNSVILTVSCYNVLVEDFVQLFVHYFSASCSLLFDVLCNGRISELTDF